MSTVAVKSPAAVEEALPLATVRGEHFAASGHCLKCVELLGHAGYPTSTPGQGENEVQIASSGPIATHMIANGLVALSHVTDTASVTSPVIPFFLLLFGIFMTGQETAVGVSIFAQPNFK